MNKLIKQIYFDIIFRNERIEKMFVDRRGRVWSWAMSNDIPLRDYLVYRKHFHNR